MSDRNDQILTAAAAVFTRHGIGKTTMADIAAEAGVSRQTLYNLYDGKEAVLRSVVRHWGEQTLAKVTTEWESQSDPGQKLEAFFAHVPLAFFDVLQAAPNAVDFIESTHTVARTELQSLNAAWVEAFTEMLAGHPELTRQIPAAQLADFIYSAATNAKHDAADRQHLERRLAALKSSVLSAG